MPKGHPTQSSPDQDMHWVCDQDWLHFHNNHCPGLRMVRLVPARDHERLQEALYAIAPIAHVPGMPEPARQILLGAVRKGLGSAER